MMNNTHTDVMDTNFGGTDLVKSIMNMFEAVASADAASAERMKDPEYVKQLELQKQREYAAARLESKAFHLCRRSIGRKMSVRREDGIISEGVIVEASFAGVRNRNRSVVSQFKVVMECGVKKVRREFTVERLPG